jgi:NADPH:quinone reductase-like Zn-dependent oxidoreductase
LQAVRDHGKVQRGQHVLINGASGGVGTFAVQIAKAFGAEVTGVCSSGNVDLVRSLGADHVVDYTKQDFTTGEERYDFLLDNVGNRSLSELRRVIKARGKLISNGGGSPDRARWFGPFGRVLSGYIWSRFVNQDMSFFLANVNKKELTILGDFIAAGTVVPVIDRCYTLSEAAEAIRYVEGGHARGKVTITVS